MERTDASLLIEGNDDELDEDNDDLIFLEATEEQIEKILENGAVIEMASGGSEMTTIGFDQEGDGEDEMMTTLPIEKRNRLTCSGEFFKLEKRKTESHMNLITLPGIEPRSYRSLNPNQSAITNRSKTSSSTLDGITSSNPSNNRKIIARSIRSITSLKKESVDLDLIYFEILQFAKSGPLFILDHQPLFSLLEKDLFVNKMFRCLPVIVTLPPEKENFKKSFSVLPLDPVQDIASLARGFHSALIPHLNQLVTEGVKESFQDLSFFTAQYLLKKICSEMQWTPHLLRNNKEFDDSLGIYGAELCDDPFTCFQILRFFCSTHVNGFECIFPTNEDDGALSVWDSLMALLKVCDDMTICRKMGMRLSFDYVKLAVLNLLDIFGSEGKQIETQKLIDKEHNQGMKLLRLQSNIPHLTVMKYSELKKQLETSVDLLVEENGEKLWEHLSVLRESPATWRQWNVDIFNEAVLTELYLTTDRGEMTENETETDTSIEMGLKGGLYYVDKLKLRLNELMNNNDDDDDDDYAILLPRHSLSFDPTTRLKDLFRLKGEWTKRELASYLSPVLVSNQKFEEIIAQCLQPLPSGDSFKNWTLNLERHDS